MRPPPAGRLAWQRPINQSVQRRIHITQQPKTSPTAHVARLSTRSRPTVPFLSSTGTTTTVTLDRGYASAERPAVATWLRHEAKLLVRYAIISWVGALCIFTIYFFYLEEVLEREYPTPHEWGWQERKLLRDAHKWTNPEHRNVSWTMAYQLARKLCLALEDPDRSSGQGVTRLHDHEDPNNEVPWEFIPHDVSGKSEEWRRGYFEAMMLTARAAGIVDGWLKESNSDRMHVWPPQFVLGPSNPRPQPIPAGSPPAPREEDCEVAFPPADRYYLKIVATRGLTPRQKMEAALEYANFVDTKRHQVGSEALYSLALAEATQGMDQTRLPYDPKTFVLKDDHGATTRTSSSSSSPSAISQNVLDALGALANHKARSGDTAGALPIYLSLLKARRSLPETPPPTSHLGADERRRSLYHRFVRFFSQPDYPPPQPDGTQPPWRDAQERCIEASLSLYIGEILYATSSREDGIAWTREGVDVAEEQLRSLSSKDADASPSRSSEAGNDTRVAKERCRECLRTGLDNWSVMVARLAREESQRREEAKRQQSRPSVLSFWGSSKGDDPEVEGRWSAEGAVIRERSKRTSDLIEDLKPGNDGITRYVKA
ncbi:hypothetical protein GMORB2_5062 [Geosmithia morbida]|uniref:MFS maltose permease n=1 Tax=Geosmithia morbida TaxID=1094350 RepID=A0A9P5D5B9_9HYPO|nr:uncharacterized protein GMORB2_5062 [Geosmithia morbida]KAF4124396.1 hypothetical protein GMORB2_5062 [Geosmithia morbida]